MARSPSEVLDGRLLCRASVPQKPFTKEELIAKGQEVLNSPTVEKAADVGDQLRTGD
jgi:hypothetical protein